MIRIIKIADQNETVRKTLQEKNVNLASTQLGNNAVIMILPRNS
jgi:hypothetical protein